MTNIEDYDDDDDYNEYHAERVCPYCSGSGEGHADGMRCCRCKGKGTLPSQADIDAAERAEDAYWDAKLNKLLGK